MTLQQRACEKQDADWEAFKAARAASETSVRFLKTLDLTGWHNLVALDPEKKSGPIGKTFPPHSWELIASFIDEWNGKRNLYFSVNEPRPNSQDGKLGENDILNIRALFVDVDPEDGISFKQARLDLDRQADHDQSVEMPPSITLDSGGGNQYFWFLRDKISTADGGLDRAKNQGRALKNIYGGDGVQNIDRIMRLPGTLNIPDAKKSRTGRVTRPSKILFERKNRYTLDQLESGIAQVSDATELERNSEPDVRQAYGAIDLASARGVTSLDDLSVDLRERFESACASSTRLRGLWTGDHSYLGSDVSGSGWRIGLAQELARSAHSFGVQDYVEIAHAWTILNAEKYDARQYARDWGKFAAPIINDREGWFEPVPVNDNRVTADHSKPIEWIDPCKWEGQSPRPREWEVEGWIPRGEVTLLYGDGGIGKTLLAHQYATAAATGRNWLGQITRSARVMAFFCEDSADELHRRQIDINTSLGVSTSELHSLRLVSRKHEDNLLAAWESKTSTLKLTKLWHELKADAIAFGADVLIIDTLADVFGGSEIDRVQVNAFVKTCLGGLATAIGGSVIALGHPSAAGKSSGSGTSGSTAWNNAARSRLYLKYPGKADRGNFRELEGMKLNYGPKGGRLKLRWNRGAFDIVAGSAPAMLRDSDAAITPTLDDAAETAVVSALIDCTGVQMSAAPNSPHFAPKVLKRRAPEVLEAFTAQDVTDALGRLETRGAVRMETVGRTEHRKPFNGYVIVQDKLSSAAIIGSDVFA